MDFEVGDSVVLAVGKKQFSKHGIPKHFQKQTFEVEAIAADTVYVRDPRSMVPVSLPSAVFKSIPLPPTQVKLGDAYHKVADAMREFRKEAENCLPAKYHARLYDLTRPPAWVFSSEWQDIFRKVDKERGWNEE